MVVLALLSDPPVVAKILRHLGLAAEPPTIAPAPTRREADADLPAWFPDLEEPVEVVGDDAAHPRYRFLCAGRVGRRWQASGRGPRRSDAGPGQE